MENKNACNILVVKSEKLRPVVKPRCRLKDNIKICFKLIIWEAVD
jgi:hypothetical protein